LVFLSNTVDFDEANDITGRQMTDIIKSIRFVILAIASVLQVQLVSGDELDLSVVQLLQTKCVNCHDDLKAAAGGGVDNLLKLDELAAGYLDADSPADSYLLELTIGESASMPKRKMKNLEWNGPLSESEQETLNRWILRGGPAEDTVEDLSGRQRELISQAEVVELIADDLHTLAGTQLQNARYLTISNLHNNSTISDRELDVYRAAIVKTLNSLSRSTEVLGLDTSNATHKLIALDNDRTIFRFDLHVIGWTRQDWDRVAQHDPFGIVHTSGSGKKMSELTNTEIPVLRADWFVFVTLQPPLYHELIGIPKSLEELETQLGIDRLNSIKERHVARAGMESSKVSVNNRLLERIPMNKTSGAYHLSYDFASNDGVQNLFENPLGPEGALDTEHIFQHDGGEVIYNLPNGFQAYMLITAKGDRLDTAPQAIVSDSTMPGGVIINGISCLSCHYQGMKPETGVPRLQTLDEIRQATLDNFRRFNRKDRELIKELYPKHEEFLVLLESDRERFLKAMKEAGIEQIDAEEPARALFDRFAKDLDLATVAAEFGLTQEQMKERMNRESETRLLLQRIQRGTLKRQLFLEEFAEVANLTGQGEVRDSKELPMPFFGDKVPESTAVAEFVNPAKVLIPGETGVNLIDAENRTGQLQVELWTADNQKSFEENEVLAFRARANEDCFLTVVSIDPEGEISLLLPNEWHPEFTLKKGQTATIPTKEMGFEFFAMPPHGQTIVKVIATKRKLVIKGADSETLRQKGIVSLGNAKAIGVREAVAENKQPVLLTSQKLEELFAANEWATAVLTVVTRAPEIP
tara:strand:+ start:716 stop:3145 length:2430 start_codon:yes stop_codon:yes gene_type:complete